jgi:small subunit ribosomal protein S11
MSEKSTNKKVKEKKFVTEGRIVVSASFNNTIVTITDSVGNPVDWISSGKLGFKGTRRSTPYAATTTLEKAVEISRQLGMKRAQVYINGPGPGRDSALKVLGAKREIDIISISDVTPIPHNGPRPPKRRRT